jgi:hypothetical protein
MRTEIVFGLNRAEYRLNGDREWFPLPWGETAVEDAEVIGHLYSSRGGAWGWILPPYTIIGYGRYNPIAKFYFSGKIRITPEKIIGGLDGYGKPIREYGMRIGDRKKIVFDGVFTPSELYRVEGICRRYFTKEFVQSVRQYCLADENLCFKQQGHLIIYPLSIREDWNNLAKLLSNKIDTLIKNGEAQGNWAFHSVNRRKIYNHQFFGKVKIYWLSDSYWAIRVFRNEKTRVVSPDHLVEPVVIYGQDNTDGWYIAEHPLPSSNID